MGSVCSKTSCHAIAKTEETIEQSQILTCNSNSSVDLKNSIKSESSKKMSFIELMKIKYTINKEEEAKKVEDIVNANAQLLTEMTPEVCRRNVFLLK